MKPTGFSAWHKIQREKHGYTQDQIAKRLGWSTGQYMSNIERKVSFLPKTQIKSIAKLYNVSKTFVALLVINDIKESYLDFVKQ